MSSNSSSFDVSYERHTRATPALRPSVSVRLLAQRPLGGYLLGVVSVALAFVLRLLVDPWLGDQSPYLLFVVAVALTGLYAGVRPALFATALGTAVAYFCFVPPRYRLGFAGVSDAVGFGVYLLAAIAVVLLTHARIRAAAIAEESLQSQVEAERRLLDAETLFRHFMDHNSACAYLRDEAGRCVYANDVARREFGVAPDLAANRTEQDGSRPMRFREQDRQVLLSGQAMEFVDKGHTNERYWLTSKFPFVDQSGRRFVGGISFEITDRLQAEEILRKTESLAAAGHMASLLAHEINNPLAALTNVLFLLEQQHLDSSSRELLSAGIDALTRINRIAAMTMGFFFEKDTVVPVSLHELIDDVADTLKAVDRFNNIHLTREFKCAGNIAASPPRIRQLIASLLTNALESDAKSVRIRVHLATEFSRRARRGVRITIADDGRGIPADLGERIFEPFFSSKAEKGTGLGLWVSRAVVARNDGTLRLRSAVTGSRRGTCVSVFLPTITDTKSTALDYRQSASITN